MNEETVSPMKKLTKLVTHTSYQLFDSFVNDTEKIAENVRLQGKFVLELQKAATQHSLVILQVRANRKSNKYETISGWVATKNVEKEVVMIRLQNKEQQEIKSGYLNRSKNSDGIDSSFSVAFCFLSYDVGEEKT